VLSQCDLTDCGTTRVEGGMSQHHCDCIIKALVWTSRDAIHHIVLIVVCVMWAFHAGFVAIL